MRSNRWHIGLVGLLGLLVLSAAALAQAPVAPVKVYTGAFGAGLALTRGNTDTVNFNLTFDLVRDPKTKNVFKANALYLRSNANSVKTADRFSLGIRDEYTFSKKTFVYGALPLMRDPFQNISYLLNPQGGIGYRFYETGRSVFNLSGGAGVVFEKDTGLDVKTSGTLNTGESFTFKVSEIASLNQVFSALWKTSDFNDSFYHFGVALTTSITKRAQLKVEFIDDYKNLTPNPLIKSNDTAFITSFLFKF
jgi:putative salt-induced outer membrane protein YdiY